MAALIYQPAAQLPTWWMLLALLCTMALLPFLAWISRSDSRVRVAVAFLVAFWTGVGIASAAMWGDFPDWCNPQWLEYWICWPW